MNSLLVSPKNTQEMKLITDLFSKMRIKSKILSIEEKEDFILSELMKDADRKKKVSKEIIMKKLGK